MKRILIAFLGIAIFGSIVAFRGDRGGKYLTVLKSAKDYDLNQKTPKLTFKYQSKQEDHLKLLRRKYNLDSVAGTGNDVSKVINLMRWTHNLIWYDGRKGLPDTRNALDMIKECKTQDRTLNCRGLAILLNEVYLSMGYQSRYVTCLPKDSTDRDCHVIDMVFIKSLKKWIWMDPTFEAYLMDEKGNLLGIEEVRNRLVNDQPLILNPHANWNHILSEKKKKYLAYMSKNLYRMECPLSSEYNYETYKPNTQTEYVQLIPLDYKSYARVKPEKTETYGTKRITKFYYISNPSIFWKKP